ncbi:putative methionyl-tRNA synthetase [Hordeum vulgare]|nr:putative methionyl-tRNA synthetase [Hordeum vulgare]
MDEIIMSDSVVAASWTGFSMQDESMDTLVDMDNELDDTEAEEEGRKSWRRWNQNQRRKDVLLTLAKAKETYNLYAPTPAAVEGRPDGTKRAKKARDTAPAAEWMQSLIEKCIADTKNIIGKREKKSDAWWSALMMKQDVKLDLLRTNFIAKKRNTDLAFLMATDTSVIDEQVKAWYLIEGGLILNQMTAPTATTTTTSTTTPILSTETTSTSRPSPTTPTRTPTPASPVANEPDILFIPYL